MSDPDTRLLSLAQQRLPADPDVRNCWGFILQGIEVGWLDPEEIEELIQFLRDGRDWGNEELLFAHIAGRVQVSFLDDHAACSPIEMAKELEPLVAVATATRA